MNEFLLVLTGGAVSLVSSATVTWLQTRHANRGEARTAARESTRRLTGLFIAERDAALEGAGPTAGLAEAETLAVAIADRRTRERIRAAVRLLRELRLTELQELSGQRAEHGRRMLCDHALEVLGAHFRGERLPAAPQGMQKMLEVEDEALSIRSGSAPGHPAESAPAGAAATGSAPTAGAGTASGSGNGAGSGAADSAPAAGDEDSTAEEQGSSSASAASSAASGASGTSASTGSSGSSGSSGSTDSSGSSGGTGSSGSSARKPGRRPRAKTRTKDPDESDFWND